MNEWKDVVVVYAKKLLFATVESSNSRRISGVILRDWNISLFKGCPYLSLSGNNILVAIDLKR